MVDEGSILTRIASILQRHFVHHCNYKLNHESAVESVERSLFSFAKLCTHIHQSVCINADCWSRGNLKLACRGCLAMTGKWSPHPQADRQAGRQAGREGGREGWVGM